MKLDFYYQKFKIQFQQNKVQASKSLLRFLWHYPYLLLFYPFLILYRYNIKNKLILQSKKLDVIVISHGGVATTFLLRYLSKFCVTNNINDKDGLKHLTYITHRDLQHHKFIFLHGNIEDAENSLIKRGWLREQVFKMAGIRYLFATKRLLKNKYRESSLAQIEYFRNLANQFSNILIISYDELWNSKNKLSDFLDISNSNYFEDNFPEKRERSNSIY